MSVTKSHNEEDDWREEKYSMCKSGKFENSGGRYPDKLLLSKSLQRIEIYITNHSPHLKINKYG